MTRGETIERDAWVDLFAAAPAAFAAATGLAVHRVGSAAVLVMQAVDHSQFNRAIGLGIDRPATPAALDEALRLYGAAGIRNFIVHAAPMAEPPELAGWLVARGLSSSGRQWGKFRRDAGPVPPATTELEIRTIDRDAAPDFSTVICRGFGMPPELAPWIEALVGRPAWQIHIGYDQGRAVTAGALFIDGRTAWLGMGATVPEYRGRSAHRAIMSRRVAAAAAAGCAELYTETGEVAPGEPNASWNNMVRNGFELLYRRPNYRRT